MSIHRNFREKKRTYYKASLTYDGYDFCGWQSQPRGKSVQGELVRALSLVFKSDEVHTIGSGRTDAKVHALNQVCRLEAPFFIKSDSLLLALNSQLPPTIRVLKIEESDENFHPVFGALKKEYVYLFTQNQNLSPFLHRYITQFSSSAPLNIQMMKKGLEIFIGEHDFVNYSCTGTPVNTTIREIFSASLEELVFPNDFFFNGVLLNSETPIYKLSIIGNGFLKQMVRLIMGTLFEVGRGKVSSDDVFESLKCKMDRKLGSVAPPNGLYLKEVEYR